MKPTVQTPDFHTMGNDYPQAPLSSFFDTDPNNYQDGIYTKLADSLTGGFADENGFNKRRVFQDNEGAALSAGELFNTPETNAKQPATTDASYGLGDIVMPSQYIATAAAEDPLTPPAPEEDGDEG